MPTAIGFFLFAGPLGSIFSFGALVAASQLAIGLGLSLVANLIFKPKVPDAPTPEDGKYNLRQNVPSLTVVLGRAKKSSDYVALEEKNGQAHHVMVIAGHRINRFVKHYLHDEEATFGVDGVITSPSHFDDNVEMYTRLGLDAEMAFPKMVALFPSIWTSDHRGDGLASVHMIVHDTSPEEHQKTFPQQMPAHSSEIEGALLFDPRDSSHDPDDDDTWDFSTNLALERLFHLTHPSGGKMTFDDMHIADWINAANVCDQSVTNKQGGTEDRYHGGFWYRYENDPVQIGRIMDQAAELVLYETEDGKVGVHAGEYVEPDIRLTEDDIISVSYDANRRMSANVLAVRGQYTDPGKVYNTVDAAIYGDPYEDETERSKTVQNVAVQSHNHMQRLQKITYIRSNAPRVRLLVHYEPAKKVPYRRFIKVHYPPKMDEAVVEITGRPKLSLKNLTYEVEGIVVPGSALYTFDAATEEGEPPADIIQVEKDDIPVPAGFDVVIQNEVVTGGSTAAYGMATWDAQPESFTVEVEWQLTSGGTLRTVRAEPGEEEARTGYLSDGAEYRFRARNWSAGVPSDWTSYVTRTATADPVAPGVATGVTGTGGVGEFTFNWMAPNSANYLASRLYLNTVNDFGTATIVATEYGSPNASDIRVVSGLTAGTYYGWVEAINKSGVGAAEVATGSKIVT
jgi:hypothetical protein